MRLHQRQIITIQQPVHLLASECHELIIAAGPMKAFFGKRLVIQDEPVVLPEQAFNLVALPVAKAIEHTAERIMSKLVLDHARTE